MPPAVSATYGTGRRTLDPLLPLWSSKQGTGSEVTIAGERSDAAYGGPIMVFDKINEVSERPPKADKSALGAINRPLQAYCNRSRYPGYFVKAWFKGT